MSRTGARQQAESNSDEWYTPLHVFEAMGVEFDLDVAHPGLDAVGWVPCRRHYSEGSLERPWSGFCWCNSPFGGRNGLIPWLDKFMVHGDGVALTPDRTSAPWWQWFAPLADAVLFCSPKIHFIPGPGVVVSSPAQGTTLLARGERGVRALANAERNGLGVRLK